MYVLFVLNRIREQKWSIFNILWTVHRDIFA